MKNLKTKPQIPATTHQITKKVILCESLKLFDRCFHEKSRLLKEQCSGGHAEKV